MSAEPVVREYQPDKQPADEAHTGGACARDGAFAGIGRDGS